MSPEAVHVFPLGDIIDHDTEGMGCECLPVLTVTEELDQSLRWIILHNALDGRQI